MTRELVSSKIVEAQHMHRAYSNLVVVFELTNKKEKKTIEYPLCDVIVGVHITELNEFDNKGYTLSNYKIKGNK